MIRNLLGGLFALGLMLSGTYSRAKKRVEVDPKITSLFFHTINKELFRKCIVWLKKNGYVFLSSEQLVGIIKNKMKIPPKAVWITFDDGWKENVEQVIPIITEFNIPVTFFISTDPVENSGVFWWSYVSKYGKYLPHGYNNLKAIQTVDEVRRKELIQKLEDRFNNRFNREAMEVQDVINISKIPQITVGCHTVHHVIMPNCTDAELDYEVTASRQTLEKWIDQKVKFFSYPDGDYNPHVKDVIKAHGFELAATTDNRFIVQDEDLFAVPRFWVRGDGFFYEAKCQLLGIWVPFMWRIQKWLDLDSNIESLMTELRTVLSNLF